MSRTERFIWVNGELVPEGRPVIPAESRGLMYGAGCFETLRMSGGRLFQPDLHLERLNRGLSWLGSDYRLQPEVLGSAAATLAEKNRHYLPAGEACMIRIQASLGGSRGYGRIPDAPVHILISCDPAAESGGTYSMIGVETTTVPSSSRPPDLKLSNTLHYMQAWREAREQEFDDALILTVDGRVAESAVANLFWKTGNVVRTPSEDCDILPGLTRKAVLELLEKRTDCRVEIGSYSPDEPGSADLVWITNSLKLIQQVTRLDGREFPEGSPFLESLKSDLLKYMEHQR